MRTRSVSKGTGAQDLAHAAGGYEIPVDFAGAGLRSRELDFPIGRAGWQPKCGLYFAFT
jgi:hypothetical protein